MCNNECALIRLCTCHIPKSIYLLGINFKLNVGFDNSNFLVTSSLITRNTTRSTRCLYENATYISDISEISTLPMGLAFLAMWLLALGWVTRRHVTFGGSGGIR